MPSMRIALVTGANRGLGFETSRQLARHGIRVLVGARDRERGEGAARVLREEGCVVEPVQLDVTHPEDIDRCVHWIDEQFGKLDILVNNAGIVHEVERNWENSAATVSSAALRETFDVNFFGLVALTQGLLPLIKASEAGRIVNVSSSLGSLAIHGTRPDFADTKPLAYCASKAAVNMFTIHLAAALADTRIKVNSVNPGWVRTELGGEEAPLSPEEGARTAVQLATVGPDGPTGRFFHEHEELPW